MLAKIEKNSTPNDTIMSSYRKFKYLFIKEAGNQRNEDVLEYVYDKPEKIRDKFVAHEEVTRSYYVFDSYQKAQEFIEDLPDDKRTFHETIFGWKHQKIKFDIDIKEKDLRDLVIRVPIDEPITEKPIVEPVVDLSAVPLNDDFLSKLIQGDFSVLDGSEDNIQTCSPEDILRKFMGEAPKRPADNYRELMTVEEKANYIVRQLDLAITKTFYLTYFIQITDKDIVTCSSCGRDTPTSDQKFSYHKIINGYYVNDHREAKLFTDLVVEALDPRFRKFLDGVNKQTQNLRLVGNHKAGSPRVKMVVSGHRDEESVVTIVDKCQPLPSNINFLDVTDRVTGVDTNSRISAKDAERIVEKIKGYTEAHRLRERKGNLFIYQRVRPEMCLICNEVHHRDNTLFITCTEDSGIIKIYMNCRHAENAPPKYLAEVISHEIEGDVNLEKKDFATERVKAKTAEAGLKKTLKNMTGKPVEIITLFETLPDSQKHVYCEPALLPFELKDTLCVKAKMKMGKTKNLMQFINTHFRNNGLREPVIRILSFRQTFSGNIKEKFPDFTLYSDVKGPLTQSRLICQIESLHRVEISPDIDPPDLLVMDECESIFEQFESGLLKNFALAWATFQWMVRNSKYLICMDANLSERTYRVLKRMRVDYYNTKYPTEPPREIFYHHNKFKNQVDDHYYFTTDKNKWYYVLQQTIEKGYRVVCPMSSLSEAEILKRDIETRFPDNVIGFYSSKTSMSQKREHFNNVAEYWSQYDTLIYTPTVSAGVSYEEKHYDKVFAYFTDKACNVETCLQMLGRIRNVGQREYYICLSSNRNNLPTDIEDIEECVNKRRLNLFRQFDSSLLHIEFEDSGEIKCHRSDYFYLWLENTRIRNLSLNDFSNRMARYIAEGGAHCDVINVEIPDEKLADIAKNRRKIKVELSEENIKQIVESEELDEEGVKNIQDKFVQQADVSVKELCAYEKYKLRRDYTWDGPINASFVKKYNNRKARRVYRNLSRILSKKTIDEALEVIKKDERSNYVCVMEQDEKYQHSDLNRRYVFDQHRISLGFLRICGFQNLTEQHVIPETRLFDNFREREHDVIESLSQLRGEFEIRNFKPSDIKYTSAIAETLYVQKILRYMNKILAAMYDIRIAPDKVDRQMYHIKYSGLFGLGKTDDRPYVEAGVEKPDGAAEPIGFEGD